MWQSTWQADAVILGVLCCMHTNIRHVLLATLGQRAFYVQLNMCIQDGH
jgi:hypothetical protein